MKLTFLFFKIGSSKFQKIFSYPNSFISGVFCDRGASLEGVPTTACKSYKKIIIKKHAFLGELVVGTSSRYEPDTKDPGNEGIGTGHIFLKI